LRDTTHDSRLMLVLVPDDELRALQNALVNEGFLINVYMNITQAMAQIYQDPPNAILLSSKVEGWKEFLQQMKSDTILGHLPLMVLLHADMIDFLPTLETLPFDDFVIFPAQPREVPFRLGILIDRTHRALDANPLTRLPGNYSITLEIEKLITGKSPFGLGYIDLDNFKAFNDRYGFSRGDEAIRMTARILTNVVRGISGSRGFVGHVGGDDFVFIVAPEILEECCRQIVSNFEMVGNILTDEEDRKRGYFESFDRKGNRQVFPLLSVSIAAINSSITAIEHPGEAAAIAGELKKEVKKLEGSNYLINRRSRAGSLRS
jgi:GGDEF domain-containing protein